VTFILSTEIGRTPHRDRSTSGSRSVALRTQIGPNPRRDRSHSAPRSVPIRVEIGPLLAWRTDLGAELDRSRDMRRATGSSCPPEWSASLSVPTARPD